MFNQAVKWEHSGHQTPCLGTQKLPAFKKRLWQCGRPSTRLCHGGPPGILKLPGVTLVLFFFPDTSQREAPINCSQFLDTIICSQLMCTRARTHMHTLAHTPSLSRGLHAEMGNWAEAAAVPAPTLAFTLVILLLLPPQTHKPQPF